MSRCNRCGFEMPPTAKFCDNCGATATPPAGGPPSGGQQWGQPPVGGPPVGQPPSGGQQWGQPPAGGSPVGGQQWGQPSGQPPVGQPPSGSQQWGQPPVGGPPVGQPPSGGQWGQPPVGQPPVGQPPVNQQQWQNQQPNNQPIGQQQNAQPIGQQPIGQPYARQGGVAVAKKNNKAPIIITVALIGVAMIVGGILLAVNLFFGSSSDEPNIGVWTADEITMMGMTMNPTDLYPDGITLELKSGGNCTLSFDGDDYNSDYEIEGGVFKLIDGGDEFPGTIEGDVITIVNLLDMGMDIRFVKEGGVSVGGATDGEDAAGTAEIDENDLTGRYILSSMTTAGVVMNYDAIQQSEIEMTLEIDGEEGNLVAYGSSMSVELDTSAKTMLLQGVVMDYVIDGENIVATGENEGYEMTFVFTNENSSMWDDASGEDINATGFVAPGYGAEQTMPVETLSNPSVWYGIVTISDYVGSDDISGEYEAWGYIGSDEIGDFFELYLNAYVDSEDHIDFMSFNIELHDYSFFPIVDEHAWLYGGATLKEEDNTWFNPNVTNGTLTGTYNYDYDGEAFTIDFNIAMVVDDTATSGTEGDTGSDAPSPEPEPEAEPEPAPAAQASFTMDELRDVYLAFQDLGIDEKFALTDEEVIDTYFGGIAGNITNDNEYVIAYQWLSIESETSLLNITFDKNEDGTRTYKSMSINNIDYE